MIKQRSLWDENTILEEECSIVKPNVDYQKKASQKSDKATTKTAYRRRKKATTQVQDYYALLGISEDATAETIKRSYIGKVKQYPPESHPEEFQNIRRAYDNLRDPDLRKNHDILRKYGESIEDLIAETSECRDTYSGTNQAIKLLQRAVDIDPSHIKARFGLACIHLEQNNTLETERQFTELKKIVSAEQWLDLLCRKIAMMCHFMKYDDAFAELQKLNKTNPNSIGQFWGLYLDVYEELNIEDKLLPEIEKQIQEKTELLPTDMIMYIGWISLAYALEKNKIYNKAQTAAKKFIKSFHTLGDKKILIKQLAEEASECQEAKVFTQGKVFIDLALFIDKNNKQLQEQSQQLQLINALMNDFERATMDCKLFPLALLDVLQWFVTEFNILEDMLESLENMLTEDYLAELKTMDEEYAAGIIYIKKRYPNIYRHYQRRWDNLFKEKTAGLNREERRNLRI